ncbi:Protein CBG20464 [Caenorhabditis briggsae]|uniref:Protein CBG20464 n=2 Tax=Caenorhabditis briggsae TaxID=6238 RepID=A8XXV0_CAEBR|nr:Protein CBG20464 [Caenorhabditis briggsae]ULU11472.1 hypothetical protein L3Y34_015129 [Caenorhabditis briggsae]CAP37469.2 Protein CBG20464 [Caenorhabditis briggsae]
MNRIRAALPWRKKTYYGDSDSTGYCSSSDVSKALSDSQFILRPNTALLSSSYSNGTNYYALTYTDNSRRPKDKGSTITSRSSTISSTTFKSHSLNTSADGDDEDDEDEASTIRANSVKQVPMMPKLTSLKHLMTESSSEELPPQHEEMEDDVATLEEVSMEYDDDEDDDVTLDIPPRREYRNSSFRSFPFSYQLMESEMDRLFDMMQVDEQIPSTSHSSNSNDSRKKRLLIREPTSTIYYHDVSSSEAPPPRPFLQRTESVPRSILKNSSSFAIYEEIYGDHLTPPPIDIRPQLPERPIMAFQQFPPCNTFQPRLPQRMPSVRRRKKMPSLHHSTSFASYFRRRK